MKSYYGIAIMGLNGAGKSTLAHALSKRIGYYEMDVEDYYFPDQRASRRDALDGIYHAQADLDAVLPFSAPQSRASVEKALLADIKAHPQFIISGVTMNWCEEIMGAIRIAFLIETPLELRLARVEGRETQRFGDRVLKGGDMYEQQRDFRRMIAGRNGSDVEESAQRLRCPVVRLNGVDTVEKNVGKVLSQLSMHTGIRTP